MADLSITDKLEAATRKLISDGVSAKEATLLLRDLLVSRGLSRKEAGHYCFTLWMKLDLAARAEFASMMTDDVYAAFP